jgi:hypothetical protein
MMRSARRHPSIGMTGIDQLAVHLTGQGRLGQARPDRSGHFVNRHRLHQTISDYHQASVI